MTCNMRRIAVLAEWVVGAATLHPGRAMAAPANTDTDGRTASVAEIVVTAQKREENL